MTHTQYNPVPAKLFSNYFGALVGKFYKILPMYEEQSPTVGQYINSLMFELTGGTKVIEDIKYDGRYMALVFTLGGLSDCDDVKVCRREVFKCIRLIEEINKDYEGGD